MSKRCIGNRVCHHPSHAAFDYIRDHRFSLILYDKAMITNACREGARQGIIYRTNAAGTYTPLTAAEVEAVVNSYLNYGGSLRLISLGSSGVPVTTVTPGTASTGEPVLRVSVAYTYTFLVLPDLSTFSRVQL